MLRIWDLNWTRLGSCACRIELPSLARGKIELTPIYKLKGGSFTLPPLFSFATEHKSYVTVTRLACSTLQRGRYLIEEAG